MLFITNKNCSNITTFEQFINSYNSSDINLSNSYLLNKTLPKISGTILNEIENSSQFENKEILNHINNLIHSVDFTIISNKNLIFKSTIKVKLNYYDLSKYILSYFKELSYSNDEEHNLKTLNKLSKNLSRIKYKLTSIIDINLVKVDNTWKIILSEELLDVLSAGIYSAFTV